MTYFTITEELNLKPPIFLDIICHCERQGHEIRVLSIDDIREYHCDRVDGLAGMESEGWSLRVLDNWLKVRERWLKEVRTAGYQEQLWKMWKAVYGVDADKDAATNAERDRELKAGC